MKKNLSTNESFPLFRAAIAANIRQVVATMKRDGTCGMSARNLLQVTPSPHGVEGPRGTNAQWVYAQMFNEVLAKLTFRGFAILS